MPSVTWDSLFEGLPADTDEAKYGASRIRQLKLAIRERMELETNFQAGTQPFIKAGRASVIFSGTTTEINNLTGMSVGALAWDTTLKVLRRYTGTTWAILDVDHGYLTGLSDDDHPQYLHLNKTGQTLDQNLAVASGRTIDGRDISVDGAKLDNLPNGLPPLARVLDRSITEITVGNTTTETQIYSYTIPGGALTTNKQLRLIITGSHVKNAPGISGDLTVRLKYGGTTVATRVVSADGDSPTVRGLNMEFYLSARGTTNSQFGSFTVKRGDSLGSGAGTGSEDSTIDRPLIITVQFTSANSSITMTKYYATLELLVN